MVDDVDTSEDINGKLLKLTILWAGVVVVDEIKEEAVVFEIGVDLFGNGMPKLETKRGDFKELK